MKKILYTGLIIGALSLSAIAATNYKFIGGFPTPETTTQTRDEIDHQRALSTYRFWYPVVSTEGMMQGNRDAGIKDGTVMTLATDPHFVLFTANSDTPYGGATFDLTNGPVVIDVPAGKFIGIVNDHFQRWVLDIGIPGPDAGKGGKHLVLPPNYKGKVPAGYYTGKSNTNKVIVAIRILPEDGDMKKAIQAMKKVKIYYLNEPQKLASFVDVTGKNVDCTLLKWEDNIKYWEKLHKVINEEPIVEDFLPMYGELEALGIAKGKPFKPNSRMKKILVKAAEDGKAQMITTSFDSNRADRFMWKNRKWEWIAFVSTNGDFRTPSGMDLEARERWFTQAVATSPAMVKRTASAGSLYWLANRDKAGQWLDGGKTYKLNVPLPVPAKLFWSVTAYDAYTRSQVKTDQNKAALRSLVEMKNMTKGSVDLYFGPTAPKGHEDLWIKTIPGKGWFGYFRIYGPEAKAFDGSWRPGDFEEVKE